MLALAVPPKPLKMINSASRLSPLTFGSLNCRKRMLLAGASSFHSAGAVDLRPSRSTTVPFLSSTAAEPLARAMASSAPQPSVRTLKHCFTFISSEKRASPARSEFDRAPATMSINRGAAMLARGPERGDATQGRKGDHFQPWPVPLLSFVQKTFDTCRKANDTRQGGFGNP